MELQPLTPDVLPHGVRSRFVDGVNGLTMHVLEAVSRRRAGWRSCCSTASELAYSWRRVLPALAVAGYHAIAPDQRGCRTTGWDASW